jgi:hypothetical protein
VSLKIQVNKGVKISEQPLITNDGLPSSPAHLEGLRRLLTSAAKIGAVGKLSNVTVPQGVTEGQDVLKLI